MVDEDASDRLGRHREEVSAILPLHAALADQPEISLVDERGGLEGVPGRLVPHPVGGTA